MALVFRHAAALWSDHPQLAAGALYAGSVDGTTDVADGVADSVADYTARAVRRLDGATEGEFPEVLAWRRAFSRLGLKPTQYRCASESLLRRLRKHGGLPRIHPVVDLCNAISVAYAVPVAALDADRITGPVLEVRYARGNEHYTPFGGGPDEQPAPGEVTFVDGAGRAHARRWTNRQSGFSAVGPHTRRVLVVTEALHDGAAGTVREALAALDRELRVHWASAVVSMAHLSSGAPEFACRGAGEPPAASGGPAGAGRGAAPSSREEART
ncbi:B3/4 domain-containing protein [Streptomyces sp. NPDC020917]|uniref:B3/4 domain-containing protein n=1 Tax=Streptomyces sp. NPDC020917 TaxID=3365102 RepID=UPI0037B14F3E